MCQAENQDVSQSGDADQSPAAVTAPGACVRRSRQAVRRPRFCKNRALGTFSSKQVGQNAFGVSVLSAPGM
jgi:hypothetical protein